MKHRLNVSNSFRTPFPAAYIAGAVLWMAVLALAVPAETSGLDPAFGTLGKVVNSPDESKLTSGNKMALLPDGKIVMLGNRVQDGRYAGIIVARYNGDGILDTTFGTNGWATATFGHQYEFGASIAVQPDGKIVIGMQLKPISNGFDNFWGIVRFNSDGTPDTSFDSDGKVTIDFDDSVGAFYTEVISTVRIAPDGKIVAAGFAMNAAVHNKFVLARLNANGSPDAGFGTNGEFGDAPTGASNHDSLTDMIVLPDGKIVAVGFYLQQFGSYRVAIKYGLNGAREWAYVQGAQTWPNRTNEFYGVAALPNGKLIAVGRKDSKVVAMRLNADGTDDASFTPTTAGPAGTAQQVAIQTDGKIVANVSIQGATTLSLVRFNSNGSLDTDFGLTGVARTGIVGQDYGASIAMQPDGKILVGGSSQFGTPTEYYFTMVRYLGGFAVPFKPLFDYDGDGKADVSVFRPSNNAWYVLRSTDSGSTPRVFAAPGDVPAPADFDGDGNTDLAVFRPSSGDWWYLSSLNNGQYSVRWGTAGDLPRPGDFDGDGKMDFIVYRPSNSTWYRLGSTGATSIVVFGLAEDKAVVGDFDGDGKVDPAIFRPSTGDWWYAASGSGNEQRAFHWGANGDIPAPADFDADGKTDFAVFRPSNGAWFVYKSSDGGWISQSFGLNGDRPVPADYDGDGKADIAVFRPSSGDWYLLRSTAGFTGLRWGTSTDIATESAFVP